MYPDNIINMLKEYMPGSKRFASAQRNGRYRLYIWIGFLCFKVLTVSSQAKFAMDHFHDFQLFSGAASTFFVPLLGMSKLFSRLRYDQRIAKMFDIVENEFWDLSIVRNELKNKLSRRMFLISFVTSNHVYMSLSVCVILIFFPLAKYPDETKQLPSVGWFPFDTNPTPVYQIVWVIIASGQLLTIMANAAYDQIYIYFCQHLSVQFCILKELLRNITVVPSISDEAKYDSKEYQEIINTRLQTCVKHHIRLANFLTDIQEIFSLCLGIQVMLSILSLVFIGYLLETEDNDLIKTVKLLLYVTVLSVQATIYALHGSELEYQYETVAQAIYDSQWYFGNSSFRKGVQLVQMTSQIPVHITALGLVDINNPSIIVIYKTVFSVLTLLQEMVE